MILRQEIFDRVVSQLELIRTTNTVTQYGVTRNYFTDAGLSVFPWRTVPFQTAELPAIIVRDLDEPVAEASPRASHVIRQLHMQVEVVVSDENAPTILRQVFADIEACIGEGRESVWADITSNTRPRITRSVVEQESAKLAGGVYEFFIDYPSFAFQSVV